MLEIMMFLEENVEYFVKNEKCPCTEHQKLEKHKSRSQRLKMTCTFPRAMSNTALLFSRSLGFYPFGADTHTHTQSISFLSVFTVIIV